MAPETKDKPGHVQDDNWRPPGISKEEARDMEARAVAGADQDRAAQQEKDRLDDTTGDSPEGKSSKDQSDTVGKGFSNNNSSRFKNLKINLPKQARNKIAIGLASATIAGAVAIFGGLFSFLNVFKLDHFMQNVEKRGFMRYQVDIDGRSSKWLQAYMTMRMGEVDSNRPPGERENLFFRANRVDTNNPLTDWYRTLRSSKFEDEVFEKHGIRFFTVVKEGPNGTLIPRPGYIEIDDRRLPFDPSPEEMRILTSDDPNELRKLDSKFADFIKVVDFDSDKGGRKKIKQIVNDETRWWQVIKRFGIRKDIQNKIGTRDWRFFEKTRDKISVNTRSIRNKIILNSLPEDTKSGKFARCIFGLECPSSRDPASPSNRSSGGGNGGNGDLSGNEESRSIKKEFAKIFVNKFLPATSLADSLSTLINLDKAIENGSLSKMVAAARGAQALGVFTTYSIMRDQMKTQDVTGEEINTVMQYANAIGKNDAWTTALSGYNTSFSLGGKAYALEANASSKEEYCSKEYQEKLKNKEVDVNQYAHKCPGTTIGSATNAKKFEDSWNNGPTGKYLRPILKAANTGSILTDVVGFFNNLIGSIADPAVTLFLKTAGLDDDQEKLAEWIGTTVTEELGAGPMLDTGSPSNLDGILAAQGGAYGGESSARQNGAAITNDKTKAEAKVRIANYKNEQSNTQTFAYKHLSLDNPDSTASKQLYALSTSGKLSSLASFTSSILGSIGSIPKMLTVSHTSAANTTEADDGYSAARYAEIDTYDYPDECINGPILEATPSSLTNADELGLIPAEDLTWDLVTDNNAFYDRLYQDASDDQAVEVYNCALLDNVVRGGLGGMYGYKAKNTLSGSPPSSPVANDGAGSGTVGEDVKENAKKLLEFANDGRIKLDGYSADESSDRADRSLSSLQLEDMSQGKKAKLSTRCGQAIPREVTPDPKILQFLVALAGETSYTINTLFGQCHTSASSNHYKGKAVDFGCPMDISKPDAIGREYGISRNPGEDCSDAGGQHYHYSTTGD